MIDMPQTPPTLTSPPRLTPSDRSAAALWRKAQELEATFLAEMLRHSGLGGSTGTFGGGLGEEQVQSFLRQEQARAMARAGGIGLAEPLFRALQAGAK